MSWLSEHLGPNPTVDEIMEKTGALLVGNNTHRGDDPYKDTEHEGEPYGGGWDGPQFVLTHHVPDHSVPGVTFVGDLDSAVKLAKDAVGDKYVGVLGAEVARQCLETGQLDEIFVSVAPVLLGDGVRLFDHPGGRNVRLETMHVAEVPSATNIRLRVVG
jgi:dihydrofolate reductase